MQKTKISLNDIQNMLYKEYITNGYLDSWTVNTDNVKGDFNILQQKLDLAEVGLFISEIAEAQEILRNYDETNICNFESLSFECVDIIIRVLNFASRKGIDIEKAIFQKHTINMTRGKLHGKNI